MSLREEIEAILRSTYNRGQTASKGYICSSVEDIINKCMDAAIEADIHQQYKKLINDFFYDIPRCIDNTDSIELSTELIEWLDKNIQTLKEGRKRDENTEGTG